MQSAPTILWDRKRVICAAVLCLQGAYRLVLLFTTASLIGSHPVLLETLRGSTSSLIAAGAFARIGQASLPVVLLVPIPTLMMSDPVVWWAGRLWGPEVVDLLAGQGASGRRGVRRAMRWVERWRGPAVFLAPILPVPSVVIYAAAGWTGMRLGWFLVCDVLGTFGWIVLMVALGYSLGHSAVNVAHTITHYSLYITIGLVVVSVGLGLWRGARVPPPVTPEAGSAPGDDQPPAAD